MGKKQGDIDKLDESVGASKGRPKVFIYPFGWITAQEAAKIIMDWQSMGLEKFR